MIVAELRLDPSLIPGHCATFAVRFCHFASAGFCAFAGYCGVHATDLFTGSILGRVQSLSIFRLGVEIF